MTVCCGPKVAEGGVHALAAGSPRSETRLKPSHAGLTSRQRSLRHCEPCSRFSWFSLISSLDRHTLGRLHVTCSERLPEIASPPVGRSRPLPPARMLRLRVAVQHVCCELQYTWCPSARFYDRAAYGCRLCALQGIWLTKRSLASMWR